MALLIGETLEHRKRIVMTVKTTYGKRSAFVHHGRDFDDVAPLDDFLGFAWACLFQLLHDRDKYTTRFDLLRKLDDMKLS
jgi:hypothetical protein